MFGGGIGLFNNGLHAAVFIQQYSAIAVLPGLRYQGARQPLAGAGPGLYHQVATGVVIGHAEQLQQTRLTQPAIFAVSYALAQLWQSYGVRPAAVLGHSIGEFVAATLTFECGDTDKVVQYMAEAKRLEIPAELRDVRGIDLLRQERSVIPAVTHVDDSARVQTVDAERYPLLHRLLSAFHAKTGCPVLVNTSFNLGWEPIVCSPEDAWHCFMGTHMDVLVMENHVLLKDDQPDQWRVDQEQYLAQFALD